MYKVSRAWILRIPGDMALFSLPHVWISWLCSSISSYPPWDSSPKIHPRLPYYLTEKFVLHPRKAIVGNLARRGRSAANKENSPPHVRNRPGQIYTGAYHRGQSLLRILPNKHCSFPLHLLTSFLTVSFKTTDHIQRKCIAVCQEHNCLILKNF